MRAGSRRRRRQRRAGGSQRRINPPSAARSSLPPAGTRPAVSACRQTQTTKTQILSGAARSGKGSEDQLRSSSIRCMRRARAGGPAASASTGSHAAAAAFNPRGPNPPCPPGATVQPNRAYSAPSPGTAPNQVCGGTTCCSTWPAARSCPTAVVRTWPGADASSSTTVMGPPACREGGGGGGGGGRGARHNRRMGARGTGSSVWRITGTQPPAPRQTTSIVSLDTHPPTPSHPTTGPPAHRPPTHPGMRASTRWRQGGAAWTWRQLAAGKEWRWRRPSRPAGRQAKGCTQAPKPVGCRSLKEPCRIRTYSCSRAALRHSPHMPRSLPCSENQRTCTCAVSLNVSR